MKLKETITAIAKDIKALNAKTASGSGDSQSAEIEIGSTLRSACSVHSGAGNTAVYQVLFKKPFSKPPRLQNWCVVGVGGRVTAMYHVYDVTERGFLFTQNYLLGDVEINYTAVVDK